MLNIHELESRWLRYKIKSFIPHIIIIFSLLIIITITTQVDFTESKTATIKEVPTIEISENNIQKIKEVSVKRKIIPPVKKEISQVVHVPAAMKQKVIVNSSNTKLLIQPSLDFMQSMQEDSPHYYRSYIEPSKTHTRSIAPKETLIKETKTPEIIEVILEPTEEALKKVKITQIKIKRQNTQEDIQHVIKRFKTSNNPALSLFIAKKYYELKNYNQSYNYALMTNELNSDIEESWIIFTKSLYKLNKKDKAIEILQKYIATSHSHRAKVLLDHIKTGKMK